LGKNYDLLWQLGKGWEKTISRSLYSRGAVDEWLRRWSLAPWQSGFDPVETTCVANLPYSSLGQAVNSTLPQSVKISIAFWLIYSVPSCMLINLMSLDTIKSICSASTTTHKFSDRCRNTRIALVRNTITVITGTCIQAQLQRCVHVL